MLNFKLDAEINKELIDSLKKFLSKNKDREVTLSVDSPGGFITEGLRAYKMIKAHGAVTVQVEGIAASIASVLILGAAKVEMQKGSALFIHNPFAQGEIAADSKNLRKIADNLDKMKDEIIGIYKTRSKLDESQLSALMENETFIAAPDAVRYGLADCVIGEVAVNAFNKHGKNERVIQLVNKNQMETPNETQINEIKNEIPNPETQIETPAGGETPIDPLASLTERVTALEGLKTALEGIIKTLEDRLAALEAKEPANPVQAEAVIPVEVLNRIKALEDAKKEDKEKRPVMKAFKPEVKEVTEKDFLNMSAMERAAFIRAKKK